MLDIEQSFCNFSKLLTNFSFLGGHIHTKAPGIVYRNYNLFSAKCNKNKLNRTPKHDFMRLYFPLPQCLSQDVESGCLKLAVVKFLGVQFFKGDHNILIFQP